MCASGARCPESSHAHMLGVPATVSTNAVHARHCHGDGHSGRRCHHAGIGSSRLVALILTPSGIVRPGSQRRVGRLVFPNYTISRGSVAQPRPTQMGFTSLASPLRVRVLGSTKYQIVLLRPSPDGIFPMPFFGRPCPQSSFLVIAPVGAEPATSTAQRQRTYPLVCSTK